MKKTSNQRKNRGFTLIEILLVMTLLGIVISFFGRGIFKNFFRGRTQAAKISMKQLEGDLDRYRLDCNFYPTTDQGLKALVEPPSGGRTCKNYDPQGYITSGSGKSLPKDPWGNEFVYTSDDGLTYEIKSLGDDGKEGGEGNSADISSNDEK